MATVLDAGVVARDATGRDNEALLALSAACPMEGDVSLCVSREPDFFALNRLQGDSWSVGVTEGALGHVAGCIAVAERQAWVHGRPSHTTYVSDLKVYPEYRGQGYADALSWWAAERCRALGDSAPVLYTVLGGNAPMERRLGGRNGLPPATRVALIRSWAITFLWRRRAPSVAGLRLSRATWDDIEEMTALWRRVGQQRQFAPCFTTASFAAWVQRAPGLDIGSYTVARRPNGRIAGFLALWDQSLFKQLRVTRYTSRLAAFRRAFNAASPLFGATTLPPTGGVMRHLSAVHVCCPSDDVDVMRALVVGAYNEWRGRGYSFFTVGLDVRDPLRRALGGLLAQPADIGAYVTTPCGPYRGQPFDERPLHFEIALA